MEIPEDTREKMSWQIQVRELSTESEGAQNIVGGRQGGQERVWLRQMRQRRTLCLQFDLYTALYFLSKLLLPSSLHAVYHHPSLVSHSHCSYKPMKHVLGAL